MTDLVDSPAPEVPAPAERSAWRELPFLVVLAVVLALLIKAFLLQAFYIPSGSMQNTLQVGDRVLVNKLVYDVRGIHRGEVVVFDGLDNFEDATDVPAPSNGVQRVLRSVSGALGIGSPSEKDYIKRVIGIAGDRVMCCSADGHVVVQPAGGAPVALSEPYLFEDNSPSDPAKYFCAAGQGQATCPPGAPGVLVQTGRLWVMGDHRSNSLDSRGHRDLPDGGTVPADQVVGRAFVVVFPLGRAGLLRVPSTFTSALGPVVGGAPVVLGTAAALPLAGLRRRRRRP